MNDLLNALFTALMIGPAPVHLTQPPPLLVHYRVYYAGSGMKAAEVNQAFDALAKAEGNGG